MSLLTSGVTAATNIARNPGVLNEVLASAGAIGKTGSSFMDPIAKAAIQTEVKGITALATG